MTEQSNTWSILRPLWRGLPLVICLMVLAVLAANRYLRYATPMFESVAKIKLANDDEGPSSTNLYKDFDVFTHATKIAAEVELIKSSVLLHRAVASLDLNTSLARVGKLRKTDLYGQSPILVWSKMTHEKWYGKPFGLLVSRDSLLTVTLPNGRVLRSQLGRVVTFPEGKLAVVRNKERLPKPPFRGLNDRYELIFRDAGGVVESLHKDLDVVAVDKDVPVLRIAYKCPVPQKAADVVNAVATAYIADGVSNRYSAADTTVDFLSRQLRDYQQRLASSESAIEGYRDSRNIVNIRQETETDLRKLSDLKKQATSVHMNLLAIDSLNRYLRSDDIETLAPNFEAFNDLLSTEIVKKIKGLQSERKELLTRYTPQHEKLRLLDGQMDDLAAYLRESVRNTRNNLSIKYEDLQRAIGEAEQGFVGLPSKERTMTVLERNFNMDEQIYKFLHQKRTEAEIARSARISFHRIITEGKVPRTQVSPNPTLMKVLAGFLALMVSVLIIYGVHMAKARVNDATTIHRQSETPLLTAVPHLPKPAPCRAFFRQFALRTDLKGWLSGGAVVVVSSFTAGEGKRFVTTALTHALAYLGKSVLVVDADDLTPALMDGHRTDFVRLSEQSVDWQRPADWHRQLADWRTQYDVIVVKNAAIDTEPVALMLMASATLNLLLLDSRRTPKARITEADLLHDDLKLPRFHFVLNRAGYTPSLLTDFRKLLHELPRWRPGFVGRKTKPRPGAVAAR